ncbi:hypothetical protein SDC9_131870 [bioreactor metagenome]|uniref:Uncharacterized protein n=1 Tax=bioreactor metagenome TaxID=1076179 RepID=A0A645D638_9ZZZZ
MPHLGYACKMIYIFIRLLDRKLAFGLLISFYTLQIKYNVIKSLYSLYVELSFYCFVFANYTHWEVRK